MTVTVRRSRFIDETGSHPILVIEADEDGTVAGSAPENDPFELCWMP